MLGCPWWCHSLPLFAVWHCIAIRCPLRFPSCRCSFMSCQDFGVEQGSCPPLCIKGGKRYQFRGMQSEYLHAAGAQTMLMKKLAVKPQLRRCTPRSGMRQQPSQQVTCLLIASCIWPWESTCGVALSCSFNQAVHAMPCAALCCLMLPCAALCCPMLACMCCPLCPSVCQFTCTCQ